MPLLFLVFAIGCSDYEVSPIKQPRHSNWFDAQSEDYRSGLEPSDADTGGLLDTGMGADDGEDHWPDRDEDGSDDGSESDEPESDEEGGSSSDGSSSGSDGGGSSSGGDDDDSSGTGSGSGSGSGSSVPSARLPAMGDLIITELMIYPQATDDSVGEWVESRNVTGDWLNAVEHRLADRGVDDVEIVPVSEGSLIVAPGEYLTICAAEDYWDNGGVDCDGTFHYWTFGGGFALSNTEDEVQLVNPSGSVIDEVRYGASFPVEGEALGLKAEETSAIANDSLRNWCAQDTFMPFGDAGTPGEQNDSCW